MLNYSTHAIVDLLGDMRHAMRSGRPRDGEQTSRFIDEVIGAHKFVLPDHGSLIYDMREVPEGIEITRLPFPVTVMEVPFPPLPEISGPVISSSKRLILAREGVFLKRGVRFRTTLAGKTPNAIKLEIAAWYDDWVEGPKMKGHQ